jgi:hypothetical protein
MEGAGGVYGISGVFPATTGSGVGKFWEEGVSVLAESISSYKG